MKNSDASKILISFFAQKTLLKFGGKPFQQIEASKKASKFAYQKMKWRTGALEWELMTAAAAAVVEWMNKTAYSSDSWKQEEEEGAEVAPLPAESVIPTQSNLSS